MKKILLAFGTRPEAIKMAPLYLALKKCSDEFLVSVVVSAQHRHMLDQVLNIFNIIPDYDLNLMTPGQDLYRITDGILLGMKSVLEDIRPDILLVHGDTTTAFAASLAGYYSRVPIIGHVEAGLRTNNIQSPYPEELNRQVISRIANLHFAPTISSYQNLLQENIPKSNIALTGNTVIDAMQLVLKKINNDLSLKNNISNLLSEILTFELTNNKFILITGHRRENFGDGFVEICYAIKELALKYPTIHFIYPVHLNPNVQKPVKSILDSVDNVHLIAPLQYEVFLYMLSNCELVLTDSGGIQEEAPSLGKPVLVMRDATERPEGVASGLVKLVGSNRNRIVSGVSELLDNPQSYNFVSESVNPYGNGDACKKIIKKIRSYCDQ